ncbi:g1199 [Coccomyxa elongata]
MQVPAPGRHFLASFLERSRQQSRTVCLRQELEEGRTTIKALESQLHVLADELHKSARECNKLRFRCLQPKKMGATPVSVWSRMQQPSLRSATLGHSSSASGPVLESMDDGTTQLAVRTPQIASVLLAASVTFPEGSSSSREAGIAAVASAPRTPSDEQEGDLVD